jgi:molybdopterin-guanine dinucleotide biosynthesis protein A
MSAERQAERPVENERAPVAGLVLAGGLARRMGGRHKAFLELGGRPLIMHAVERLRPQVAHVAISANAERERLRAFAEPVLADPVPGFAGPLAGVLAGLEWLREEHPDVPWLLTVAVDTPFFPPDLAAAMLAAVEREGADMAVAASGGRAHPVFGLWPVTVAGELRRALVEEDLRKIDLFTARYRLARVSFHHAAVDPFFNVNRPEDLVRANNLLQYMGIMVRAE